MNNNKINTDIVLLYELSLSIGQTLNLNENIENFIDVIMSQKDMDHASVWIKKSELDSGINNGNSYKKIYSSANDFLKIKELNQKHEVIKALNNFNSYQIKNTDPKYYDFLKNDNKKGTLLFYKLGELGFITFFSSKTQEFELFEINKLTGLMKKFTVSIEASIYYNRAINAKNERIAAEQHIRLLFNNYHFPVIIYDLETDYILEANDAMLQNYGINTTEILSHKIYDFVPEEFLPHRILTIVDYKKNISTFRDWNYTTEDNKRVYREIIGKIIKYRNKFVGFITIKDESEKINSLEEKTNSDKKYKLLFNSIIDAYAEVDFNSGLILDITPSIEGFSGYKREELIGKSIEKYYLNNKQDKKNLSEALTKNNGKLIDYEVTLVNKNGNPVACSLSISIVHDEHGNPSKTVGTMRDISYRKKTEKALVESEKRWRVLVNNSPDTIMAVKPDGTIIFQNSESKTVRKKIIGKSISNLFHEDQVEKYYQCIEESINENRLITSEIPGIDNEWTLSRFVPVLKEQEVEFVIIIATDITEQKDLEKKLNKAKKDANSANEAKSRFLANMSHEIRNPMSSIIGNAELLSYTTLNHQQDSMLSNLMHSADNLLGLIDNILDLSKIEANQLFLVKTHFSLYSEIENLFISLLVRANSNNVELTYDLNNNLPDYIYADRFRINQILLNLLDNSLKFTQKGSISMTCSLIEETDNNIRIDFSIKDTGVGIDITKLDSIFDGHSAPSSDISINKKGAGLGLSITKQLIELMNGEIKVQSVKHLGTMFQFSIIVKRGKKELVYTENIEGVDDSELLENKSILIVEDDLFNQEVIFRIIENWGGRAIIAENGSKAIEVIKTEGDVIDLVFMDLRMPVMGGVEATKIIRNKLNWNKPIIALTGEALVGKKNECDAAGMNGFISKPFKQNTIKSKILKYLFNNRTEKEEIVVEKTVENVDSEINYSIDYLLEMVDNNTEQLTVLLETFIGQNIASIEKLNIAVETENWEQIQTQAHTVKTSFKYLSLIEYANTCQKLENMAKDKENIELVTELATSIELAVNKINNDIKKDFNLI